MHYNVFVPPLGHGVKMLRAILGNDPSKLTDIQLYHCTPATYPWNRQIAVIEHVGLGDYIRRILRGEVVSTEGPELAAIVQVIREGVADGSLWEWGPIYPIYSDYVVAYKAFAYIDLFATLDRSTGIRTWDLQRNYAHYDILQRIGIVNPSPLGAN
jgi:hypothetical protein